MVSNLLSSSRVSKNLRSSSLSACVELLASVLQIILGQHEMEIVHVPSKTTEHSEAISERVSEISRITKNSVV